MIRAWAYNGSIMGRLLVTCRKAFIFFVSGLLISGGLGLSVPKDASAADLVQRSLAISNPDPGEPAVHTFSFSYASTSVAIGSIVFEYCTSPLLAIPCDAPTGIDASGATLTSQTGQTGYFILTAQTNRITLSRAPAAPSSTPAQYVFDPVVNPGGVPDTFYARISTYESLDGSGSSTDFGAVVNSTTQGLGVSSEVPPYLSFCVGVSIPADCSTAEGNLIDLGNLSTQIASSGTSQMLAATNAEFGLAIAAYGTTMTSGNNTIPALANPTVSAPGNSQFGLNLRANSEPPVGQNPSGGGIAVPTSRYNTVNQFAFASGDIVATSPNVTDTRKFTVSYVVNVSPAQTPGVYTATLTYVCTASF